MINRISHWFAHLFGWNEGKVVTWIEDKQIFVGFECSGCGKIDPDSVDKINESEVINGQ
jgi:hypothetical protein